MNRFHFSMLAMLLNFVIFTFLSCKSNLPLNEFSEAEIVIEWPTDSSPCLIACEPDTNLLSSFEIKGKINDQELDSRLKIYACIKQNNKWYPSEAYSFDAATGKWKVIFLTKNEVFDGDTLEFVIGATLDVKLNNEYNQIESIPLDSKTANLKAKVRRKLTAKPINVTNQPHGIAMVPYKEAWVTHKGENYITRIDISKHTIIERIENVGENLRGITASPDGRKCYICDYGGDSLIIINTDSLSREKSILVGRESEEIAISYDQRYALIIKSSIDKQVVLVDCIDKKAVIETTIISTPTRVAFIPFTYQAYVTLMNGDVLYFDSIPQSFHYQTITELTGNQLNGIAITPDGNKACISVSTAGKIAVLNLETKLVESPLIDVGGNPQGIAIAPDGQIALVANTVSASEPYDNKISAINLTNNNAVVDITKVENNSAFPINIAITPDGKYAFVVNYKSENVTVIRMDLI